MPPTAPLRVLHVVEAFGGGVLEIVTTLAAGLARDGDTVGIAYGRRPETPDDVRARVDAAVELHPMPWERRAPRDQLRAGRQLRRLAGSWRPDVVHLHSSFAGLVGSVALKGGAPTVYTPHGYSFTMRDQGMLPRLAYRTAERYVARRATVVGAVSQTEERFAREVARAPRVAVVRNGIPELDDEHGDGPPAVDGRARIVTLGRVDAARRPAETAAVLADVADVADVAWIGGGGRGGIPTSVVTDRGIELTGWLERPEALGRLRAATACLHWAAWDGQPLSVLEAMANDVVVVASDIPATREILGPEQVCATAEEAAALLRRIVTDGELRERLLEAQRSRRSLYGAGRMVAEWRSLYERLAGSGAGNRASLPTA